MDVLIPQMVVAVVVVVVMVAAVVCGLQQQCNRGEIDSPCDWPTEELKTKL